MTTLTREPTMDQVRLADLMQQHQAPSSSLPSSLSGGVRRGTWGVRERQQPPSLYSTNISLPSGSMEEENENPILVRPTPCSYETLFNTMLTTDFDRNAKRPRTLPPELVKRVLSYVTIKRVQQAQVQATNCSSHDGIHPLAYCLADNETTWWLSGQGSMPGGRGGQWVQFQLAPESSLRRVSAISIKIPPMPQGPLSVRDFCLQAFSIERGWHAVTPIFRMENRSGWQKFTLQNEIDVDEVRLVCLCNQMEEYLTNLRVNNPHDVNLLAQLGRFESVGFFSVKFE